MRELLIYERELDEVGLLNTLATGFISAASASFLFAVGLVTNWLMQGTIDAKGTALLQFGGIAGTVLALGFLGAGIWLWRKRGSRISEIKTQAINVEQVAQPVPPSSQSAPDTVGNQPPGV